MVYRVAGYNIAWDAKLYFLPLNVQTENRRARSQDDTLSELEADIVRGLKNFDSQIDVSKFIILLPPD